MSAQRCRFRHSRHQSRRAVFVAVLMPAIVAAGADSLFAQADRPMITLVVPSGRSLSVALDKRLTLKRIGQPIAGTVVDDVYAYDRIVIPAGAQAVGRVASFDRVPRMARLKAALSGDYSPSRRARLQFDSLVLPDGRDIPVVAVVTDVNERPTREFAQRSDVQPQVGVFGRAKREIARTKADVKRKSKDALATITRPGRMERFRDAVVRRLPYRPQFFRTGSVLTAELMTPIDFGVAPMAATVESSTVPAPESVLRARLLTPLNSGQSVRGGRVEAIVTEPVFSANHELIVAEGAVLIGAVTFAKRAARFRRNGQLRFLFERMQPLAHDSVRLLASLDSVGASEDSPITLDDEGGARATNSKTRFAAPALALLTLHWSAGHHHHHDVAGAGDVSTGTPAIHSPNIGGRVLGGWSGLGAVGAVAAQASRPVAIGIASVGAAQSIYSAIFGRGNEVSFPKNTPIDLRLAAGPREK